MFSFITRFTALKVSKYGVFSGPYFPVFGPEETPYLDTFHAVIYFAIICNSKYTTVIYFAIICNSKYTTQDLQCKICNSQLPMQEKQDKCKFATIKSDQLSIVEEHFIIKFRKDHRQASRKLNLLVLIEK